MSVSSTPPFVSVIIPARNAARQLPATLTALLAGDYPPERLEVLVVDGASVDGTAQVIDDFARRDARVRRLDNPAGSTPASLNRGLGAARGQVIVRLDAHARPAPDYVSACVAALERTGAEGVGGPMVGRGETPFGRAVALATAVPFGAGDAAFRLGGAGAADTVYLGAWRRELLEDIGGFDEGLPRNQDYELCERIRRRGGRVWLDPRIRSETLTRGSPGALARQYFGYGAGRAATTLRHPGSLRARQAIPAAFVAVLPGLAALATAGPTAPRARRGLGLVLGAYLALDLVVARRTAARAAVAEPGLAPRLALIFPLMHLTWGAGFWLGLARGLVGRCLRRWSERRAGRGSRRSATRHSMPLSRRP